MSAAESLGEKETGLGTSVLMSDGSPSVSREVQHSASSAGSGSAAEVALQCTGVRAADHVPSDFAPPAGSRDRLHGSE